MEGICEIVEIDEEEWVVFDRNFNQVLTPEIIHFLSEFQRVKFGFEFDQSVNHLPDSITHLTFGKEFDQHIDFLPNTLTHLIFGREFNKPVTYQTENSQNGKSPTLLPKSLTHLKFGRDFNQQVYEDSPTGKSSILPNSLTHIIFKKNSKFVLDKKCVLPDSITHLIYLSSNKIKMDIFPKNLVQLILRSSYPWPIKKQNFEIIKDSEFMNNNQI